MIAVQVFAIELDHSARLHSATPLWNLDRLDQRALPLDGQYAFDASDSTGAGVDVYIIDSGENNNLVQWLCC